MKSPARVRGAKPGRQERGSLMSFQYFIKQCRESKAYFRALIVRAIEDAVMLFIIGVGIWAVCAVVGCIFRLMGVS